MAVDYRKVSVKLRTCVHIVPPLKMQVSKRMRGLEFRLTSVMALL